MKRVILKMSQTRKIEKYDDAYYLLIKIIILLNSEIMLITHMSFGIMEEIILTSISIHNRHPHTPYTHLHTPYTHLHTLYTHHHTPYTVKLKGMGKDLA